MAEEIGHFLALHVSDHPRWGLESCVHPEKRAHDVMDRLAISQKSCVS